MKLPSSPSTMLAWTRFALRLYLLGSAYLQLCFSGEFRFCYNGPQRILFKDCPGGFVAKMPITTECQYYRLAQGVPGLMWHWAPKICEPNTGELSESAEKKDNDFGSKEFQSIEFFSDLFEPYTFGMMNGTNGTATHNGTENSTMQSNVSCDSCFASYLEPKYWNPAPIFIDKEELNETAEDEYRKDYVELTKVVLIKIINEDEFEDDAADMNPITNNFTNFTDWKSPTSSYLANNTEGQETKLDFLVTNSSLLDEPYTSLMKLLAKSMRVTYSKCAPFIEPSFYSLVFRTMIEFRRMNDNFPDMNVLPLKRIMNILDRCEKELTPNPYFVLNGTRCEDKYAIQTITDLRKNITMPHKLESVSFRWGLLDPIIEAAWSAIAFVHGFCFEFFITDMLHYSLFVKGMHEVFVQPLVEKHWTYPFPVGKGMTLWEMAYDTPDIQNQLNNLDACVQGAYLSSVFEARLDRTFYRQEFFDPPKYKNDTNVPAPGWERSAEEYWQMYERTGFEEMVEILGFCAQNSTKKVEATNKYAEESCFLTEDQNNNNNNNGNRHKNNNN